MTKQEKRDIVARKATEEFFRILDIHGCFGSAHEGYAVLLEEVDELWDEVRKNRSQRSKKAMFLEAKQIAAVAMKFMLMLNLCFDED